MRLTLTAGAVLTADPGTAGDNTAARTIRGLALPFNVVGHTSAGPVRVVAGAVRLPDDLRRVKLFREHGRTSPVGYAVEAAEAADGLSMVFRLARTPGGDAALVEAAEGVRDALSVELDAVTLDAAGTVTAAELVGVALTSVPAFADARLIAARIDGADLNLATPAPAGTTPPPAGAGTPARPQETTVPITAAPPAAQAARVPSGTITTAPRGPRTVLEAAATIAGVIRGAVDAAQVNAALQDVIPADDTAGAFLGRPEWVGELWTPEDGRRPFITAIGPPRPLRSLTLQGWKWATKPQVGAWAGSKAPIPSNKVSMVPATGTSQRVAGGWDVDRAFVDLGEAGFLEALFRAAIVDYGVKSESYALTTVEATATDAGNAADVPAAIDVAAQALAAVGARMSFAAMAPDVWSAFIALKEADVPWWLRSQATVNLGDSTTTVSGLSAFLAADLTAGTFLAGDRRAVDYRETGPFRLQALNIPQGGIDIAVIGYQGSITQDETAIVSVTVGPVIP